MNVQLVKRWYDFSRTSTLVTKHVISQNYTKTPKTTQNYPQLTESNENQLKQGKISTTSHILPNYPQPATPTKNHSQAPQKSHKNLKFLIKIFYN